MSLALVSNAHGRRSIQPEVSESILHAIADDCRRWPLQHREAGGLQGPVPRTGADLDGTAAQLGGETMQGVPVGLCFHSNGSAIIFSTAAVMCAAGVFHGVR